MSGFATNSQGRGEDCIGRCQRGISGLGWMGSVSREPSTALYTHKRTQERKGRSAGRGQAES